MIHFDLPKEKSSIIKVVGVGGGGSNAVNHMFSQNIEGVNFIICNTDAQAIAQSKVPNRVQLGPHLTQGLGAGANPDIGRQATEESLEEIKRILEVNTKMAFITAGMGGGTGTGGAPIISKICKELGILTVGIVTTPFSYEGKKRQLQAEEGIRVMKQYVDTLLVISNDKLRHQFGNLKMKEAFNRADNVLATAAKCITDVINSTGQINVDFADVCTVMRSGGVAILGSAACGGENRAQRTIEEALTSPLLNDNDIRGAKWILININSSEGDHEFTMDEVEIIQNYLLEQAGEGTDVILGMGYDNNLGDKIGITLIATGFEHKDPFNARPKQKPADPNEKIVLTLSPVVEEKKAAEVTETPPVEVKKVHIEEPIMLKKELEPTLSEAEEPVEEHRENPIEAGKSTVENKVEIIPEKNTVEWVFSSNPSQTPAASGGYLARPSNIYADTDLGNSSPEPVKEPVLNTKTEPVMEEEPSAAMQLVIKDDIPVAADESRAHQTKENVPVQPSVEEPAMQDEAEQHKRRAAERIQKLRNLSFNINAADPNNEFETVPAYIRRNLDLYNSISHVENFYSNYEVKSDERNNAQITTINTFLDGKKPD
ncbi:MAG: cell division protein FtsZ [Chitinophagaceae bacterium]|nr:cell division protein FtsZ [Chitinophagaceae bacterium]